PASRQLPSPRSLRHWLRAEKIAQVIPEACAVLRWHQRRTVIAANLHRFFEKELFQVGPEIIRHQDLRTSKLRHASCRNRGCCFWRLLRKRVLRPWFEIRSRNVFTPLFRRTNSH